MSLPLPKFGLYTFKSMRHLLALLEHHRFRLLVLAFLFITFAIGIIIVPIEAFDPNRNINSFGDGLWWSVTTMTGVGYGDTYPVTPLGRTLGMILMISGVMLMGLIVGFTSFSLFRARDDLYWRRVLNKLDRIEDRLVVLEKRQNYIARTVNSEDDC